MRVRALWRGKMGGQSRRKLVLLIPLLFFIGCDWGKPQILPTEITGVWKTDEPRYRGRFIKLDPDQITFGLGGIAPDKSEHIEKLKIASINNAIDYSIRLRAADGTPDSIFLRFTRRDGGELGMKNQPQVIWRRKAAVATTSPAQISRGDTLSRSGIPREHKTVYKIDCIRPKTCRSY
ncbi:MAG TPA: hypothetical protein VFA74_19040 [Terriglobales bacterium]|nr:hypothetical protein [Terriglobales bacterium]